MKARVFLSCGQTKGSDEPILADKIAQRIRDFGFDCYIAVTEQSLLGLRENIFAQLATADYFVFIDFRREELKSTNNASVCRGSLFSHQELAIASFLEIPALIFQEAGVKDRDGMLGAMQANAIQFTDRHLLPNVVGNVLHQKLETSDWSIHTRNQLSLEVSPHYVDATPDGGRTIRRHYHIEVHNRHYRKAALNCFAYLDRILNLDTNAETRPNTIEFKWAGTMLPSVRISSLASRKLDAFWLMIPSPQISKTLPQLGLNVHTDSSDYQPRIQTPGRYHLTFQVASQNFPPASGTFVLEVGSTIESVTFTKVA